MQILKTLLVSISVLAAADLAIAQDDTPVFSSATVDIGIVVSDIDKSAKFYTEIIGVTEVKGFSVTGEMGAGIGLTENVGLDIRVFVLGEGGTKLKMMAAPETKPVKQDQKFIHSTLGLSYLTLRVNDLDAAVKRAKDAGVKFEGKTPYLLSGNNYLLTVRDPDGNFIELIGPMKGE
ncbi:MAG: VOC family protein [Verrucomicrobiota bacterium]